MVEDEVKALIAAAQDVAARAGTDLVLAQRLFADPGAVIAEAAGRPMPAGVIITATHDQDGLVALVTRPDPDFQGELDDAALDGVSGGATAIEYRLIAALVSVAIIGAGPIIAGRQGQSLISTAG